MFRDRYILGVHCRNCSVLLGHAGPKNENAAEIMTTISAIVAELGYGLKPTKSHGWYVENEVKSPTNYQNKPLPPIPYSPSDVCASGICTEEVVFTHDGRKGHFCKQHTCGASDIGCVTDIYSPQFPRQMSRYCQAHTCVYYGCGARVLCLDKDLCEAHLFGQKTKKTRNSGTGGGSIERRDRDEDKVLSFIEQSGSYATGVTVPTIDQENMIPGLLRPPTLPTCWGIALGPFRITLHSWQYRASTLMAASVACAP
ncbi:hypothetical protein EDB81DRAFT_754497 [Dactylonectria macrodidyma]|uniref:Uncharacterized protein n=1 Tax=Dactylonectria macrodidyma TaxID=307937 RepID=A0A9P9FLV2_9HYPO|nr:hypothetical protein EDB81DRAFT_754497 [Dactylonectria macrodidyma]